MPGQEPIRRYASAEALADDLNRFLQSRPIKARPNSPIEHAWRWCRRQPVIATLAATLLLTLIGSFVGLSASLRRSEAQRASSDANYQVASRSLTALLSALLNKGNRIGRFFNINYLKALCSHHQEIELSNAILSTLAV